MVAAGHRSGDAGQTGDEPALPAAMVPPGDQDAATPPSSASDRATGCDLWRLSAGELAEGYRAGTFTPVDAFESCLARIEQCEPLLNAMVTIDRTGGRRAAEASRDRFARGVAIGALDGVPISVKDNLHVAGLPTSWGSRLLEGFVARRDEVPVARLRAAGAVLLGKTNLPEFAMQGYTFNAVTGVTRNPWSLALTPGGSSGGAAAGVAAGYGPLALATDGGGSTRRPASHCGLVGFKPSMGLAPRGDGLPEIFLDYEVVGSIGRSVGDVRSMMSVLAATGLDTPHPRSGRILFVPRFAGHPVDDGIAACVRQSARQFEELGYQVEEAADFVLAEPINALWSGLSAAGLAWMFEQPAAWTAIGCTDGQRPDIGLCGQSAQDSYRQGRETSAKAIFDLLLEIRQLKRGLDDLFAQFEFILTPATAALPWPAEATHPEVIAGQPVGPRGHAVFTAFANAAGLPAIALPSGRVHGLPTGFQLVGRAGADAALLALARHYEQTYPWAEGSETLPVLAKPAT